jgi:hypothetical protein
MSNDYIPESERKYFSPVFSHFLCETASCLHKTFNFPLIVFD